MSRRARGLLGSGAAALLTLTLSAASAEGAVTKERIFYAGAQGTPLVEIFDEGGLVIEAICNNGPATAVQLTTTVQDATIDAAAHSQLGFGENDDFDPPEPFSLFPATGGDGNFEAGQIIYSRPDGTHVTVDWTATEDPIPFQDQCLFAGVAQVATPGGGDAGSRRRIDFRSDAGDPAKTILDAGGLRLRATCVTPGMGTDIAIVARPDQNGGAIFANGQADGTSAYADDKRFQASEKFNLSSEIEAGDDNAVGQLVYVSPSRNVVTVDWVSEEADAYAATRDCQFVGTARVAPAGSGQHVFFARKRASVVPEPKRGVPEPEPKTFFTIGPWKLQGACGTSMALDHALFAEVKTPDGTTFSALNHIPSGTDDHQGTSLNAGEADIASEPKRLAGHLITVSAAGDILTADYAMSERKALRKRCLFAGTADVSAAP
jgi:hypothetical protein